MNFARVSSDNMTEWKAAAGSYSAGQEIWERSALIVEDRTVNPPKMVKLPDLLVETHRAILLSKWSNTALILTMCRPDLELTWPRITVTDEYIDMRSEVVASKPVEAKT